MAQTKASVTLQIALVMLAEQHTGPKNREPAYTAPMIELALSKAEALQGISRQLDAIAVRTCNGYQTYDHKWDQKAADRDEAKRERLQLKAREIVEFYGLFLTFGGDPRGYSVKIATPNSGRYNSMGGREEGWGVSVA